MEHGTYAGASWHNRMKVPMCDACREAQAREMARWRFRTDKQHHPVICRDCGSVFPDHQCHLAMGPRCSSSK